MRTSDIKSVFLSAFALFGMFSAFTLGYSAVISNLPSQVGTGSGLTSEEWNKIVGGISALDTGLQNATDKLANFSFSNGKIGIGVTNPTHGLQVSNGMKAKSVYVGMANDFSDRNGTNDNVYIREPANTSWGFWGVRTVITAPLASHTSSFHPFEYMTDENSDGIEETYRFFVDKNWDGYFGGRLGIGTTSPGQKLSVAGTIESTTGGVKFPDGNTQTKAFQGVMTVRQNNVGSFSLTNGASVSYAASCLAGEVATWGGCQDGGYKDFYYWMPTATSYTCGWYNTSGVTRSYGGAVVYVNCLK